MTNAKRNLQPPPRGFADDEYAARAAKLQATMARFGWDAVLLTGAADICYITGFLTPFFLSPTRPWFVVVPARGMPVAVVAQIGAAAMRRCYVGEIIDWQSPQPHDEGISALADTIAAMTPTKGIIGTALGAESFVRMPQRDYGKLQKLLRPRVFVDSADALWQARMQKSAAEVAKIHYAAAVMSDAFVALAQTTDKTAKRTDESLCRALRVDALRRGIDAVPYLAAAAGKGGYETIIMPPLGRNLDDDDVFMVDAGAVYDGYFCDFCRNYAIAPPQQETAHCHDVLHDAMLAGFAAARPGKTAADVWRAMNDVLSRAGFDNKNNGGRTGHGIGLQLTEKPSLAKNDNTVLKSGMTLALEPSLTTARGLTIVREENIVINKDKNEWLTTPAPKKMLSLHR